MDFHKSKTRKTINFLTACSYNPPNGSICSRGTQASSTQGEDKREDEGTTYVYTDVENFRALVQQLTGNSSSSFPQTPELKESDGRPQRQFKMDRTCKLTNYDLGVKGLQRSSTPKLFERRRNAKKLEVKQLGSSSLTRNWSDCPKSIIISPISTLNTFDIFSEQSSGVSSPLEYASCCSVPITPTSRFTVSRPYMEPEVHASTKEEPRLLQLFPLHSSGF